MYRINDTSVRCTHSHISRLSAYATVVRSAPDLRSLSTALSLDAKTFRTLSSQLYIIQVRIYVYKYIKYICIYIPVPLLEFPVEGFHPRSLTGGRESWLVLS